MQWVQIKVGQVWRIKGAPTTYSITRIEGRTAYCRSSNPKDGNLPFVYNMDENGFVKLDNGWEEVKPKPRECKCGIFRGDCTYHKDS